MTTPHKHADILRAIADGKEIEYSTEAGYWSKADLGILFRNPGCLFRIKPETITINGVECPAPVKQNGCLPRVSISFRGVPGDDGDLAFYFACSADAARVFNALVKPFEEHEK